MRRFYEQPGCQQGKLQHKPKAAKQLCTLTANIGPLGNHLQPPSQRMAFKPHPDQPHPAVMAALTVPLC